MMQLLWWFLCSVLFWALFANLMRIRDRHLAGKASTGTKIIGYAILIVGYPIDIIYNLTYGTIMFWSMPRKGEWTLTARMQRLVHRHDWRGSIARFICRYLVEPWDPGHCGKYLK
jgi:hypothetical protein